MAAAKSTTKVYVVQRYGWSYSDEYYYRGGDEADDEVVKAFRDRGRAEAFWAEQEQRAREGLNPFEWGSFWSSSWTVEAFIAMLAGLGLPPPPFQHGCHQWMSWWADHEARLTTAQRERIWAAMDRVQFFEIVEMAVEA